MPNNPEYDVAIVGASIAGCTAAILFARNDARVALIERDPNPAAYKKICTHFIQPSATPTIERLGSPSQMPLDRQLLIVVCWPGRVSPAYCSRRSRNVFALAVLL